MIYASICPLHRGQSRLHCPIPPTFQARDGGRLTRPHSTTFSNLSLFEIIIIAFALLVILSLLSWIAYTLVRNRRGYVDDKFSVRGKVNHNIQKIDKMERKAAQITKRLVLGLIGVVRVGLLADREEEGNNGAGERTRLFDNRYGYVEARGRRSRLDGNGSECSESMLRAPVMHRVSCDGMWGAEEGAPRRSQG
ncbi:hypothetical protein B0J14DRAFT_592012 [Halenospora varia]|nr:hypothetical protein B0J14DRAFT_592012 [Halenospora varia]